MTTTTPLTRTHEGRGPALTQSLLSLAATAILTVRVARTAMGDGLPADQSVVPGLLVGSLLVLLTGAAGVLAWRSARTAAALLAVPLVVELTVLGVVLAPPRLLAALPMLLALAIGLVPSSAAASASHRSAHPVPVALVALAFIAMAPVGFYYLLTGLVAPSPDVFGAYALLALLVVAMVVLARRRSWWVLAVPPASAGLWLAMIQLGERLFGWSA